MIVLISQFSEHQFSFLSCCRGWDKKKNGHMLFYTMTVHADWLSNKHHHGKKRSLFRYIAVLDISCKGDITRCSLLWLLFFSATVYVTAVAWSWWKLFKSVVRNYKHIWKQLFLVWLEPHVAILGSKAEFVIFFKENATLQWICKKVYICSRFN